MVVEREEDREAIEGWDRKRALGDAVINMRQGVNSDLEGGDMSPGESSPMISVSPGQGAEARKDPPAGEFLLLLLLTPSPFQHPCV